MDLSGHNGRGLAQRVQQRERDQPAHRQQRRDQPPLGLAHRARQFGEFGRTHRQLVAAFDRLRPVAGAKGDAECR